ncbi:MAG: alpha/beta fold hydrolase [Thermoleophilia bacterium]
MPSLPPAIDLNVRTRGEGALVVGVHDLLGSGQAVMRALRPLSTHGYRVMAPDLRGHGTSPTPEGPWSIDDLASDVARLVAAGGTPAIVVGQGLGAATALALALGHPGLVSGLVLTGIGPRGESPDGQERWMRISKAFADRGADGAANAAETMAHRPDWRGALGQLDAPAVVIAGADDRSAPPAAQRELGVWLRRARFQTVECGHDVLTEKPGVLLAAVEYLATADARPAAVAA